MDSKACDTRCLFSWITGDQYTFLLIRNTSLMLRLPRMREKPIPFSNTGTDRSVASFRASSGPQSRWSSWSEGDAVSMTWSDLLEAFRSGKWIATLIYFNWL